MHPTYIILVKSSCNKFQGQWLRGRGRQWVGRSPPRLWGRKAEGADQVCWQRHLNVALYFLMLHLCWPQTHQWRGLDWRVWNSLFPFHCIPDPYSPSQSHPTCSQDGHVLAWREFKSLPRLQSSVYHQSQEDFCLPLVSSSPRAASCDTGLLRVRMTFEWLAKITGSSANNSIISTIHSTLL